MRQHVRRNELHGHQGLLPVPVLRDGVSEPGADGGPLERCRQRPTVHEAVPAGGHLLLLTQGVHEH